jgi:hypothetical protein
VRVVRISTSLAVRFPNNAERCVQGATCSALSPTPACWGKPLNYPVFGLLYNCHVLIYRASLINTFADKETQKLFVSGKSNFNINQ